MAGIDDVARAAGVSTTTVSRALSGRGRISDQTRERVRAAADRLGYVVSASASSLASGRTQNIGVLVPLLDRWFFSNVLSGLADVLTPRGFDLTLYNLTDDPAQRRTVLETSLWRHRVDGLVTLSIALDDREVDRLLALPMPVLGIGGPSPRLPALRVDDFAVARTATEHLLALGHRDIAHIGQSLDGDAEHDIPSLRRRGFERAMADAGIRSPRFEPADYTLEAGHRAAQRLLRGPARPTAIFAGSDEMAFGALFAAREAGLDVPRDLSVVGVDGHEMCGFFGLTTIDQFPHRQGERVAEAMLGLLGEPAPVRRDDPARPAASRSLPFELVVRTSTASAPTRAAP